VFLVILIATRHAGGHSCHISTQLLLLFSHGRLQHLTDLLHHRLVQSLQPKTYVKLHTLEVIIVKITEYILILLHNGMHK